ncbi:carbohydrate ABC transporter permease [Haploplasma axanthum]|uniref:Inner membrane ABC transporter permease protein ycjP n=1 Tax=Haploplasma axanthum TaxID=29552 RepID=A0A449BCX4_HAPAX|nr:carbohydrate ABC transporter permease [Haploplasma axanthum]VEU80303.1 Inner membrane ABC transporter permease protein ycjP [Haploplasma axanthum]
MQVKLLDKVKKYKDEIINDLNNPSKKIRRSNKVKSLLLSVFRFLLIAGLGFIIVFPIAQQIIWGFHDPTQVNNPIVIYIPDKWSIKNFIVASAALEYGAALWNTFRVSFLSMIFQIISTSLAGYAFARLKFKGSSIVFFFVVLTIIIPPNAIMMSRSNYFANLGIAGDEKGLYLLAVLGMGIRSGIFIYIFKSFFEGLPKELEESAMVDGAGVFRTFWNIMLPNAKGAILTVGLFAFVWQWNDSYYTSMLKIGSTSKHMPLLSTGLANFVENIRGILLKPDMVILMGSDYSRIAEYHTIVLNVAALLAMLPLLVMYLFVQKNFVESIERTGIVG